MRVSLECACAWLVDITPPSCGANRILHCTPVWEYMVWFIFVCAFGALVRVICKKKKHQTITW